MHGLAVLLLPALALAQRGADRCRNHEPQCAEWAGRGECENNHDYMAASCPVACDMCGNGGLQPTPAVWELDFVCAGQLSIAPKDLRGVPSDVMPAGCAFSCRDQLSTCAADAANGACTKHAKVMRAECPESCGVCKALGVGSAGNYPKKLCAADDDESCAGWAGRGACADNFAFMSVKCAAA